MHAAALAEEIPASQEEVLAESFSMKSSDAYGVMMLCATAQWRSGERVGRLAERLETTEKATDVQCQLPNAAVLRHRDRLLARTQSHIGPLGIDEIWLTGRDADPWFLINAFSHHFRERE